MKNDAFELPESLYEFAQITDFPKVIESLSDLAEKEDWTYQYSPDTDQDRISDFSQLYTEYISSLSNRKENRFF